jgi:hypothetical protein
MASVCLVRAVPWLTVVSTNITDVLPYPEIVMQKDPNLNVTGKKKSKL